MQTATLKIDHENKIALATEKARDEYMALLERASVNIDDVLKYPFSIKREHDEIKIASKMYSAVNLKVDNIETKFQGISFEYRKTLQAHTKNYVSVRIEYSFEVHNGAAITIIDKIEDVDNGTHQYNMAKLEMTKRIFERLHKLGITVLNF